MEDKTYIGCSIGPIFKTMSIAQSTLELWMSSYMFSRYTELITAELKDSEKNGLVDFRMYSPNDKGLKQESGVGQYSDRMFFSSGNNIIDMEDALIRCRKEALTSMADDMSKTIWKDGTRWEECYDFLEKYIYMQHVSIQAENLPLKKLNDALDVAEYSAKYVDKVGGGDNELLYDFLNGNDVLRRNPWVEEGKVKTGNTESIAEAIREKNDMQSSRYIAVVQADGDGVGSFISGLENDDSISRFSKLLLDFAGDSAALVKKHEGTYPIYFGGDDMLFLAPLWVRNVEGDPEDIFSLLQRLADKFDRDVKQKWQDEEQDAERKSSAEKLSLSFGLAIHYHKYPLDKMRQDSYDALETAKHTIWNDNEKKRAACIRLRLASGQQCNTTINMRNKNSTSDYDAYRRLVLFQVDDNVMRSVHWRIIEQLDVLYYLLSKLQGTDRRKRLDHWFNNNFNELIHDKLSSKFRRDALDYTVRCYDVVKDNLDATLPKDTAVEEREKAEKEALEQRLDAAFRMGEFLQRKRRV